MILDPGKLIIRLSGNMSTISRDISEEIESVFSKFATLSPCFRFKYALVISLDSV